eukprot:gnl/TRDRNA2_/TRDRNA2_128668_c0_seq1.p1 gnl/TRDRNA2_/TRDRNA2_128668_c0~~gnl/TRDRNA2_/TRDRNA2_128668_c0_seq1.p1  ORF type:complete len:355 (+),score=53.91 gnl/TRDRNA2_/TRDRNA2_128668_c0_seq1:91-1155(+)
MHHSSSSRWDHSARKPPWQKVLYLRQPYEDSYVDGTFLDSLVLNANLQRYEYLAMCQGAMTVVQQLCLVCIFVCVWSRVKDGLWSHRALLAVDFFAPSALYGLALICHGRGLKRKRDLMCDAWRVVCAVAPLWVMSPMLRTLTGSWSDDTIVAMTFGLLTVHIALYDYGLGRGGGAPTLPGGAVALNAAMLAATILASRLGTADQVFAFMSFAMEIFAFLPLPSLWLRACAPRLHTLALTPVVALTAAGLLGRRRPVAVLFAVLVSVGFLGPALLLWAQRYKAYIQGPWDVAHVPCGGIDAELEPSPAESEVNSAAESEPSPGRPPAAPPAASASSEPELPPSARRRERRQRRG